MSKEAASSSSSSAQLLLVEDDDGGGEEEELMLMAYGSEPGWVEPQTECPHLTSLASSGSDLSHIPAPPTPCFRCDHPAENWLCLFCKDVLCSRFVNKHMLEHYKSKGHCLALSYSDLSVWCFICDAYLDAQLIQQLQPVYETAYILKFGEAPPVRNMGMEFMLEDHHQPGTSA
ncbi:hypothetical protein Dimus_003137 [Dionaea muscipula]